MKRSLFLAILSFSFILVGCVAINSHSLTIKSEVNTRFVMGRDNEYKVNDGLWYLNYVSPPDTVVKWDGDRYYTLIFKTPTAIISDKEFIILKREKSTESTKFMIVKINNDKLVKWYRVKNEKKYMELRKKLGVPETLVFN